MDKPIVNTMCFMKLFTYNRNGAVPDRRKPKLYQSFSWVNKGSDRLAILGLDDHHVWGTIYGMVYTGEEEEKEKEE